MATVVTCPSCGADTPSSARWCGSCGAPLHEGDAVDRDATPSAIRVDEPPPEVVQDEAVPIRTRGFVLVAVAFVVIGLLTFQATSGGGGGPSGFSARGDAGRTGVVAPAAPGPPTGIAWRAPVEGNGGWYPHQPVIAGDVVALAGRDGVTLHDRTTGEVRWHRPDLHVETPVAVFDDVVVAYDLLEPLRLELPPAQAARQGRLLGLDLDDGSTRWSTATRFGAPRLTAHGAGLVVVDRTRVVTLVDPRTGQEQWSLEALDALDASVQDVLVSDVDDVVHLFGTRPAGIDPDEAPAELVSEHLIMVGAADGRIIEEVAADRETFAPRPLALVGDAVVGVDARQLWLWDARTGAPLAPPRSHGIDNAVAGVVGNDEVAVVLDTAGTMTGFHVPTGTPRWTQRAEGATIDRLTVAGDDLLIHGEGRTSVVNLRTGQLRGIFEVPRGAVMSRPDADGSFVLATNGAVSVHASDTGTTAEWPALTPSWPAPVARDGQVAVATSGQVSLHDASSGAAAWSLSTSTDLFTIDTSSVHSPVFAEETLVLSPPHEGRQVPEDGLAGVDLVQAVFRWDRTEDRLPPTGPLTLIGDLVFVPVGNELHGYDALTGRRSFAARGLHPRGAIAGHGEYVFAATHDRAVVEDPDLERTLIAVRRTDRSIAWEEPVDSCAGLTVAGDLVLAVTAQGVSAREVHRGGLEWSTDLARPGCEELAAADGLVVALEGTDTLVGLDVGTGEQRWRHRAAASLAAAPTVAGSTVLAPLLDGTVVGLDADGGGETWSFDLGAVPASSVAVADGRYVLLTRDGELVGLSSE